jgi:uncharacterized membrane protein YbhN (UPF0104 family)
MRRVLLLSSAFSRSGGDKSGMRAGTTQDRIARLTFTLGSASMLIPALGLLTLLGSGLKNALWLKYAGMVVFAVVTGWLLHRIEYERMKWPGVGWVFSACYFLVFLTLL